MQPGMPDLSQIVLKAQQMQDAYERAKDSLADTEVAGSAGGGLVTVTVSGDGELKSVTISPDAVDPDDLETLGDLVVAAVRDANRQVKAMGEQLMSQATSGFDLSSLGLDSLGLGGLPGMPAGPAGSADDAAETPDEPEQQPGTGSGA